MRRFLKRCIVALGGVFLFAPPASGIALYSTLTETLYMDCVQDVSGTGPAYRVDMKFQGGRSRSLAPRLDSPPRQVFLVTRIVEMADRSLCNLGVDPVFSLERGTPDLNIPLVDVLGNSGQQVLSAQTGLVGDGSGGFSLANPRVLSSDNTPVDLRPRIVINNISPFVEHGIGESDLGVCLDVRPTVEVSGPINLEVRVAFTQGLPQPDTLIATSTVLIPTANAAVLGGLTTINQYDQYHAIPLLGEIPALGYLFKMDQERSSQTELVIMVGPSIITCPD